MAINKEDKQDVKSAFGKALANKVARATRDKAAGKVVYLRPTEKTDEGRGLGHNLTKMSPRYKESDVYKQAGHKEFEGYAKENEARASKRYTGYHPATMRPDAKNSIIKKYKG